MSGQLVWRQLDYWSVYYRRTWRGSVVSSFLLPLLYLSAMGVGLGSYVDRGGGQRLIGGVSYLAFIAPGLLATTSMQTAIEESTWPVYGNIKWHPVYFSMLATPLSVSDVLVAHLLFVAFRLLTSAAVFIAVLVGFGVAGSPLGAIGAWLVAVLVGMAFAVPVFGISARLGNDPAGGFSLIFRLGVIPMFLFSGAFFPISQLPGFVAWLAYLTPIWHGVQLCRSLTLGTVSLAPALAHVGYLLLWLAGGWWLALTGFQRRLAGTMS